MDFSLTCVPKQVRLTIFITCINTYIHIYSFPDCILSEYQSLRNMYNFCIQISNSQLKTCGKAEYRLLERAMPLEYFPVWTLCAYMLILTDASVISKTDQMNSNENMTISTTSIHLLCRTWRQCMDYTRSLCKIQTLSSII